MCGVYAIFDKNLNLTIEDKLNSFNNFKHRGPDNSNFIELENIFIGHHRLSIRDLSENSTQPKFSKKKKILITYNGEIYNCNELLEDLDKYNINILNRNSDTEILVNYIEIFGVRETLRKIKGMFAFVYYDFNKKKIFAVRDPFGEKPLYIYVKNKNFILTSDIHSIKMIFPNLDLNQNSIDYFIRMSYIPSPLSIFNDVYKVKPGQCLMISGDENSFEEIKKFQFFHPSEFINYKKNITKDMIEEKLIESVESQMISDVPLGTFLSGGIDSSLITAIASRFNPKITTFTMGFEDNLFDESKHAKQISSELGLKNYTMIVKPNDLLSVISDISKVYSEPFADSSQIPTYLLSKFSSNEIKVALTGDGGDELFGGYNRYIYYKLYKQLILGPKIFKKIFKNILPILPLNYMQKEKIKKKILDVYDVNSFYYSMIDQIGQTENEYINDQNLLPKLFQKNELKECSEITLMQIMDIMHYLPDDILVKTDRASMFHSLETRAPFLNKDLFFLALNLKDSQKINFFKGGKLILKKILTDYVNPKNFDRPKQGFGVPIASWMRGELKSWTNENLNSDKLSHLIDLNFFRKLFENHINNTNDNSAVLWNYLILFDWYEKNY